LSVCHDLMTHDAWVTSHPYLQPVAFLHAQVNHDIAASTATNLELPPWEDYIRDFVAGVPLLHSSAVAIDYRPVEKIIRSNVERLTASPMPQIADEIKIVAAELRGELAAPHQVVAWLLSEDAFVSRSPGLLRYVGWTALSRFLRPLVDEF